MSTDAIGKKESGKERITAAIVGLLVALGSYMLLNTLSPDLLSTKLTLDNGVTGGEVFHSRDLSSYWDGNPDHTYENIVRAYNDPDGTQHVQYKNGDITTRSPDGTDETKDKNGNIVQPPPPRPPTNTPPAPNPNTNPCSSVNNNNSVNGRGTVYYDAKQSDYPPGTDAAFKDANGNVLARASSSFLNAARIEGTAVLDNGQVLNYAGGRTRETTVWKVSNTPYGEGGGPERWGSGPLVPYKTVAADPAYYSFGQKLYVKELDGMQLPDGSTHNGFVVVGDTGGAIKGKGRLDFFSGAGKASQGNLRGLNNITVTPCT